MQIKNNNKAITVRGEVEGKKKKKNLIEKWIDSKPKQKNKTKQNKTKQKFDYYYLFLINSLEESIIRKSPSMTLTDEIGPYTENILLNI